MEESKLNVRDLAKRFEAMSPTKKTAVRKPQTVRSVKRPIKPVTVSISTSRPPPPIPIKRKRSSRKRLAGKFSNSVTELRITTGPADMAIRRKSSSKMKKSKSADANIASFLSPIALSVDSPKILPTTINRPKPQVPPKPNMIASKSQTELASTTTRVSQMIQKRQEELAKLSLKPPSESTTPQIVRVPKSPQQRPKIPPPSPEIAKTTEMSSPFKNRRRVVRKPSHKPPAPPVNLKPKIIESTDELLSENSRVQFDESETSGHSETSIQSSTQSIRCRLPDGTAVPLLPKIPAPQPPPNNANQDDSNLYEEIEYEFMVKEQEIKNGSIGYTPKFTKKLPGRYTPPDFYRSSHPDLNCHDSSEYDQSLEEKRPTGTQTLGRSSAQAIVAAFRSDKFFNKSTNDSMSQSNVWPAKNSVEKLSQIKSGIQSKMDWIKQKMASKKSPDQLFNGNSEREPSIVELDARYYGDDWSSDDDFIDETDDNYPKNDEDNGFVCSTKKYECIDIVRPPSASSRQKSLLAEIESAYQEGKVKNSSDTAMNEISNSANPSEQEIKNANLLETHSCCSSSMHDEEDLNIIVEEMTASVATDDTEERKSLYESQLPVEQPLYQIYMLNEQKLLNESHLLKPPADEHESDSVCDSNDTDDMTTISVRRQSSTASTDSGRGVDSNSSRQTSNGSMRRDRLTAGSAFGSQRSLWCELVEVKSSGLLTELDHKSRKIQEAYFEVITSEASYLRSLNVLINNFFNAPELKGPKKAMSVITSGERKHLFSNILAIRDCSEQLLRDLECRLKENLVLADVCDILSEHLEKKFHAYVVYCSNQMYQDRVLKRLKATNSQFLACLKKIEMRRELQGLDLRSFLMLPMQRATRYRLLLFAILDHVPNNSPQEFTASRALNLANLLVHNCNEGARLLERTEQLLEIERRLVYKNVELKRIPLVRKDRYVVKSGQLTQFVEKRYGAKLNMILQTRQNSRSIYMFLFSDLLMICNKKPNGSFTVKDYCFRRFLEIEPVEANSHKIPISIVSSLPSKTHLFLLTLMQNARGKQTDYLLNADSETDRERWLSSVRPPACSNPDEKIYAAWDCPEVLCRNSYEARQEDELTLQENDLVNVLRKMPDGWYFGERIKDGTQGWFPSSYVQQVVNDHVRANNYRQRLRIIQTANEIQSGRIQDKRISLAAIHVPPLKDRLRRLSNPRTFFIN